MSTRYRRGRDFEYRVRDELLSRGYWVIRAAGSHGAVDLLALHTSEPMLFVQCKRDGRLPKCEAEELRSLARLYQARAMLACGPKVQLVEVKEVVR